MLKFLNCIVGAITGASNKWKPPKRNFELDPDLDLTKELKPCDIFLYRLGKGNFLGGVISHMTSSPYTHAEIHMHEGYSISAAAVGMTYYDTYRGNVKGSNVVDVFKLNRELTREERLIIEAKASQSLLKPYDYINLIGFHFLSGKLAAKKAGNDAYICSEHVAWVYKNAGIDLIVAKPESIEAPADIGMSGVLNYVGTFSKGMKLKGNWRNEFIDEEPSWWSKFVSKLMGLFSKRDEYYEGMQLNRAILEGKA